MDSVLIRFKDKNYYVKYDDLLNKANDKFFAYEDKALERNAKINGKTLMFNKSDMEDKLKKDIHMPTRMPSNLATEDSKKIDFGTTNFKMNWEDSNEELNKENKMTNEQKLRKYIRKYIMEIISEGGDPYGRPDEDKYLFKTGQDYLAGIQSESTDDDEMDKKERAGKQEYQKFFSQALSKFGHSSVDSMPDAMRKEFYNYIDSNWTSSDENIYQRVESVEAPSAEELAAKETAAKEKAEKTAYNRFFSQALAKFGYSGVASIPDEKKREFYDFIDQNWTSKQEASKKKVTEDSKAEFQKRLDLPKPYPYEFNNRIYQVRSFGDEDSANEFLEKNSDWGVLDVKGAGQQYPQRDYYEVIVAKTEDKGIWTDPAKGWTDPAGGEHLWDDEDPAKMYEDASELFAFEIDGKKYNTHVFHDDDSANKFMSENPGWGVIGVEGENSKLKAMKKNLKSFHSPSTIKLAREYKIFIAHDTDLGEGKIDETSGTGGIAGYETPMAFTGKKGVSKKQKSIANQLGYELVDKSYALKDQGDPQDLHEAGYGMTIQEKLSHDKILEIFNSYSKGDIIESNSFEDIITDILSFLTEHRFIENKINEGMDTLYFKDDSLTAEQKLGLAMRHVRNNLQEVERIVRRTIKMKNEENIDSTKVGKRTYNALKRINEKVVRLMVAMNDLK